MTTKRCSMRVNEAGNGTQVVSGDLHLRNICLIDG